MSKVKNSDFIKKIVFVFNVIKGIDKIRFFVLLIKQKLYWHTNKKLIYSDVNIRSYNIFFNGQEKKINLRMQDLPVFFEIFYLETYKFLLTNCRTILDLGAHIGLTTIYFQCLYKEATIFSVEPSASNYNILNMNVAGSNKFQLAISNQCGSTSFYADAKGINHQLGSGIEEVNTITLHELIKHYEIPYIDILKVDIEGAESLMFQSIDDWQHKVGNLIIECHGNQKEISHILDKSGIHYKMV